MTATVGTRVALGLDPGSVRVGLAASDPTGTIASPVASLRRTDPGFWGRIRAEAAARGAGVIVVGLPRAMAGGEGAAAAAARAFAAQAAEQTGLAVEMWDERLTTVQAERALLSTGMRRRRRRELVDAVAAGLMLQAWLDRFRGTPGR